MNALEDRLRDAYRAVADTVDPATVPSLSVSTHQRATLSRRMRLLTPLAAAAAVTAVVVTLTTLSGGVSPRHHARTVKPRPAAAAAAASLPTFTVVDVGSSLQVYNTVTGVSVATIEPPGGQSFQDVASGGTAQTFLAATGLSNDSGACHAFFYRFQLSATGKPSGLTFLRSVPQSQPTAIAATQGGGTYAYSTVHCDVAPPNGGVGISGQAGNRFWDYPTGDDYTFSLGATADGRTLAMSLYVASGFQDLLLNTQSTSSTVEGASRVLTSIPISDTTAISPDGKTLYVCTAQGTTAAAAVASPSTGGTTDAARGRASRPAARRPLSSSSTRAASARSSTAALAAYSTVTGAQIRVLHQWPGPFQDFNCQVSMDSTGRFLLVGITADIQQPYTVMGFDLQSGASATIPVHPDVPFRGAQFAW